MKVLLSAIIAMLVASAPMIAEAQGTADTDASTLEALNRDWLTAYKTHDGETLDRILAPEFEAVYPGNRTLRKADIIRIASGTARTIDEVRWDNLKIMVFGEVAVVSARSTLSGTADGKPFTGSNDYADVYVKRNGRWVAVSAHVVRATP